MLLDDHYSLLYEVWEEAEQDRLAIKMSTPDEEAILYKGIKIIYHRYGIRIYNTKKGSFTYPEIEYDDYLYFIDNGFRKGVYYILKRTYQDQITTINAKIQSEVNQRNNKKHYDSLKLKRDNIINKYTQIIKHVKL
jgi:hypothetical protein|tara:strand:+ start:1457 stop:1864 length:408 start_codon:yes stop_codon:yes gene_type:complete